MTAILKTECRNVEIIEMSMYDPRQKHSIEEDMNED